MLKYSKKSLEKLATCDTDLQKLFGTALSLGLIDITITQGARSKAEQDEYFKTGKSKVQWPNSKHNVKFPNRLSNAIDVAPFVNGKISWKKEHCIFLAGIILTLSKILNIPVRWGGNWDMDTEPITDQDFQDLVHFELIK